MRTTNNLGLGANRAIYDAIRSIAQHGLIDPRTGTTYKGRTSTGYVAKIHDDPSDELCGTIDVKEWNVMAQSDDITLEGYHEGVHLSAIQDSTKGMVMVPKLYSDVMIAQDAESGIEYVTMFSHVDIIKLDSQAEISIGVTERKELNLDSDDEPDIDDLEPTGLRAVTTFTKDGVTTEVVDEEGSKSVVQSTDSGSINFDIENGKTTFTADNEHVEVVRDDASVTIKKGEEELKVGSEVVKVKTDGVYLGSDSQTSHAVLGEELADILCDILDQISQIKTPTMLGPQIPINMPQFISQKIRISAWKGAVTKILSSKVNVQK